MNPYEMKAKFLEALARAFGEGDKVSPVHKRHGMIRSNAPKRQKNRPAHSPRPRKPSPRNRAQVVAKQKKAR
jgi:hypothetical protein